MKKDELYLENIDEYVNDENKVVTYKWLSQTLQVQCNTAKQMLYKFIQEEKVKKKTVSVTYFVSGITKPNGNGEQVLKCCVVPEQKLDACKKSLAHLTSCHVYSVQKSQLKDSNALYMTDVEKTRENIFESNKYSSIHYDRAVLRSQEDMDLLSINTAVAEPEKKSSNGVSSVNTSSTTGKKQPKSAIANMFAKADTTKKAAKDTDSKPKESTSTKESESKPSTKGGKGQQTGKMSNFFSKQTDKKDTTSAKPAPKEDKKTEKKKSPEKKKSQEKKKSPPSKSKKTPRQIDSDDEEDQVKSKRRRIKPDLFDSSDEEGEAMEEDEEPIPPTPPKKDPSPEPETRTKEDSPEVEVVKEDKAKATSPKKESGDKGSNSGTKKRRRVRKQVKKTYMDEKGFMVTEKVWESDSTDASEAEEPVKKAAKETTQQPKGKKSPQKKPSPGKKGSGKQTSLMSFFKKS